MSDAEDEKIPSIGISYSAELPGKRSIVLQSFVERDGDAKHLDTVLDKIRTSAERQFAFGMLEALKLQLEQEMKLASDHEKRMAQVDENMKREWGATGRKGDPKLSSRQQQEQRQAYAHAEECKRRISKVKQDIAECEAKIGA